jgi:hypothetical protein
MCVWGGGGWCGIVMRGSSRAPLALAPPSLTPTTTTTDNNNHSHCSQFVSAHLNLLLLWPCMHATLYSVGPCAVQRQAPSAIAEVTIDLGRSSWANNHLVDLLDHVGLVLQTQDVVRCSRYEITQLVRVRACECASRHTTTDPRRSHAGGLLDVADGRVRCGMNVG